LLEYETIDGFEVEMLVNGAEIKEIEKVRNNRKDGGMAIPLVDGKKSTDGKDPVGNTGPVTI
jgi:cell division protease FtsH